MASGILQRMLEVVFYNGMVMNLRLFWTFVSICICCVSVSGQGILKKLKIKGKGEEAVETIPDTLSITLPEGVVYYPCLKSKETNWIVSGGYNLRGKSSEELFVNSLLYAIEQAEAGKEHVLKLDISQKSFSLLMQIPSGFYPENKTYYKYANTISIENGRINFLATEMHVCSNNLFGDLKETLFESLQPEKKAKHKNYINELAAQNSIYLHNLFEYVKTNKPQAVTHWEEISAGKIINGMNTTECLLAVGKPLHIRESGNQIKWMVNNDFVVLFENGIVVRVIK